jgi:hypothetical protein
MNKYQFYSIWFDLTGSWTHDPPHSNRAHYRYRSEHKMCCFGCSKVKRHEYHLIRKSCWNTSMRKEIQITCGEIYVNTNLLIKKINNLKIWLKYREFFKDWLFNPFYHLQFVHFGTTKATHFVFRTVSVVCSIRVRWVVGSIPGQVQSNTIKLVFVHSRLSTHL